MVLLRQDSTLGRHLSGHLVPSSLGAQWGAQALQLLLSLSRLVNKGGLVTLVVSILPGWSMLICILDSLLNWSFALKGRQI